MTGSGTDEHLGQHTGTSGGSGGPGATASRGFRLVLLVVLVLVLVGSWVFTGTLVASRTASASGSLPERVLDVTSQFMLRLNTYGPDDLAEDGTMPDYRERVSELITASFRADFETQVGTAEQTVAQASLGRECEIYGVGVSAMDADSASALVAGAFVNSYPGSGKRSDERIETDPAPFRVRVDLVKVEGEWLVDDFAPVTGSGVTLDSGEGAQPDESGDQPSDQPSAEPTEDQQ